MSDDDEQEDIDVPGEDDYCCITTCDAPATQRVYVSIDAPHDQRRDFCYACYCAYMIGVQHGRHHEACRHGATPGDDDSQTYPERINDGTVAKMP